MLVISAHADTNFPAHRLATMGGGILWGHLDNFVGVHAVMLAYFSGRLNCDGVRIELTYGEEQGLIGAKGVVRGLDPDDTVLVVDVTATPTKKDLVFEKCRDGRLRQFLVDGLGGLSYDMYEGCPDPVSDCDETDVYVRRCRKSGFLGIPCYGGDYNRGPVWCRKSSVDSAAEAICRLAERHSLLTGFGRSTVCRDREEKEPACPPTCR